MDQRKTDLPHFASPCREEVAIPVKVIGVLQHTKESERARAFLVDPRFQSNSNLYIEVLRFTFNSIGWDNLPKELCLQMDNTSSTNKNSMYVIVIK